MQKEKVQALQNVMDLRSKIRLCADLFMVVLYHADIYS